jgi:hypothetical protein
MKNSHLKKTGIFTAGLFLPVILLVCLSAAPAFAALKQGKMSTPILHCVDPSGQTYIDIAVTGGSPTGAPAGFSLQWMTEADFTANGGWYLSDDPNLCKGSFSGNANLSRYNLSAGQTVTVRVGDLLLDEGTTTTCPQELACSTTYVFHAFAHAKNNLYRSDFTRDLYCSTAACEGLGAPGCTYTQGYWKTHAEAWPVASLTLGTVDYNQAQLLAILDTSVNGNGLIALAHQLIAAKLNIADGADGAAVADDIAAANALIGSLVVPPIGAGSLPPSSVSGLVLNLDSYNSGGIGPGHCE